MAPLLKVTDPLFSGDTNRNIQDKVFDIRSSKDFDGVSDGITNDTNAINTGITKLATLAHGGVLIIPPNTIYTEASIVHSAKVLVLDIGAPGIFKVLIPNTGTVYPITNGGFVIKPQNQDGILLNSDDLGTAGNPLLRLLNATSGQLAGLLINILNLTQYIDVSEEADPGPPSANTARLYAQDNGAGKTQLMVRFNSGLPVTLATQP